MSICVVPFVVCLVLRSLRFAACRVFSGCISLGVKQVTERLGITSGGLLNLKLPEPDAMIGHARLAPGDDRRMEREASRSGRRRRQTPKKQVTGIRGWLRTNDLRFWRPPFYVWCASSGICGVRHACRGNRNRLCINTNNRSRGSLEVVRIFRLSRSSRACRPRLGRAAGLESSRHRVSAWEAALRLRRLLSRIGMTHFARDAPAGYGADAELPASPRHPQAR